MGAAEVEVGGEGGWWLCNDAGDKNEKKSSVFRAQEMQDKRQKAATMGLEGHSTREAAAVIECL